MPGHRSKTLGLDFGCWVGTGDGLDSIQLGMFHGYESCLHAPGHFIELTAAHDHDADAAQVGITDPTVLTELRELLSLE